MNQISPHEMSCADLGQERHLFIHPNAVERLHFLVTQEKEKDPANDPVLRIRIDAGGCSGFQYSLHLEPRDLAQPDDILFFYEKACVVIDPISLDLLDNGVLEYKSDLMGEAFVVQNPKAASSCGCGSSFSLF